MNDVMRFISKFHSPDDTNSILDGECSYWFAVILYRRFIRNGAKIMFDAKSEHFGTKIGNDIYDISGVVSREYDWISWLDMGNTELKEKVTRKLIMF